MVTFDSKLLEHDRERRQQILPILQAALEAVEPRSATRRALLSLDNQLNLPERTVSLDRFRQIFVVGAGKAAAPMAQAVEDVLGGRITAGVMVTKYGHTAPTRNIVVREAGHPVPDEAGVAAAQEIMATVAAASTDDLVLCLLSGGGSALLSLPAEGLSLEDKRSVTQAFLRSGATINELNAVRKHLSAIKGGQLARQAAPATVLTLVLSDVVGNPLDVIASGPTVPDSTSFADAWAVVERYDLANTLPEVVRNHLQAGLRGEIPDTPKPDDPIFANTHTLIVGDNALAAEAAVRAAQNQGFHAMLLTTYLEGEAREVAKVCVAMGKEVSRSGRPIPLPACLIFGGETTVTVRGDGKGGRNQELALSAAFGLKGHDDVILVSLATDGNDGPTDAAGGVADSTTLSRGDALGLNAADFLRRNDAYTYLHAVGDLLLTGPTNTNVNDLIFVFVMPKV